MMPHEIDKRTSDLADMFFMISIEAKRILRERFGDGADSIILLGGLHKVLSTVSAMVMSDMIPGATEEKIDEMVRETYEEIGRVIEKVSQKHCNPSLIKMLPINRG